MRSLLKYFDSTERRIGLAIYGIIVLIGLYYGVKGEYNRYLLRRDGIVTTGTLISSVLNVDNVTMSYTFIVDGKMHSGSCDDHCTNAYISGPISIIYLPSDPDLNEPACEILGTEKAQYP